MRQLVACYHSARSGLLGTKYRDRLIKSIDRHGSKCHWCGCRIVRLSSLPEDRVRILGHYFVVWKTDDGLDQALIASLDHLLPRSRGGHNGQENLVPACKYCNEARSNRTPETLLVTSSDSVSA